MKPSQILAGLMLVSGCGDRALGPHDAGDGALDAGGDTGQDAPREHAPRVCPDAADTLGIWLTVASGTTESLNRVWGSGPDDVWAVGARGTVIHWDGFAWSGVTSGTVEELRGVWGSGPDDVWAVGDAGAILHWNGSAWFADTGNPLPSGRINGVWGSGPDDVWAVGDAGAVLHWNGSGWSAFASGTPQGLLGVWGSGPDDVWAVGGGVACWGCSSDSDCIAGFTCSSGICRSTTAPAGAGCADGNVTHWNGSVWSVASNTTSQTLDDVWGSGPGDVWAAGAGFFITPGQILHSDGSAWSISTGSNYSWFGLWGSRADDVWAVGGATMHWNGSAWSGPIDGAAYLRSVWGSGRCDVWSVGDAGAIVRLEWISR